MVQNLRYIDDQLEAIKQTQWYYFFKIWVYAVEAEFALQLKDDKRYDFLMDEINRFDRLLPSELHRNRLAKIFKVSFKTNIQSLASSTVKTSAFPYYFHAESRKCR
jgi:hypothetical protein